MLEVLSEKQLGEKKLKPATANMGRIQKVDNLQTALKFVYDCGVHLELKPSAENLVDGGKRQLLSLFCVGFAIVVGIVVHSVFVVPVFADEKAVLGLIWGK